MLNWKRFFIGFALFFAVVSVLVGSSVYFFDVNDYSNWISKQIKDSTGYDLRFEQLDNNWITDNRVSLVGVSLYQQEQRVALIEQVDINIDKLDLWQRQLDINSIDLKRVVVEVDMPSLLTQESTAKISPSTATSQKLQWDRLLVKKINIIDFNARIENQLQHVQIAGMNVSLNNLLIINNKQLQQFPQTIDIATQIQSLQLQDNQQSLQLNELQLLLKGDLLQRQALLNLELASVDITAEQLPAMALEKVQVDLQLMQDNLRLNNLTMDVFSGSLALQANTSLGLTLLPKPDITVKEVVVEALQLKNMQLIIPQWQATIEHNETSTEQQLLPLESLLIETLQLQNINIKSDNMAIPLTVNSLQLSIFELSLIKNNQWVKVIEQSKQGAMFHVVVDYFRWANTIIEQLSVAGSLTKDDQSLLFLQQQFVENKPI